MKKLNSLLIVVLLLSLYLYSCEQDEPNADIKIESVWINQYDLENEQITTSVLNRWVRLQGSGFSGLLEIYCNGVSVAFVPVNVTDNNIIFRIPAVLPVGGDVSDKSALNTIRIVTKHGQAIYQDFVFVDQNKIPSVSSVSSTMPFAGEVIQVKGANLKNTTQVFFPGDLEAEVVSKNDTIIEVRVPAGVNRNVSGSVKAVVDGGEYSSPPYMYYTQGIFMKTTNEVDVPMSGGTGYVTYSGSAVKAYTGLDVNPENVIAIPATPKDMAIGSGNDDKGNTGWLRFAMVKAIQKVIANPDNGINGTTPMNNLAIQFDLYMNQPWPSGVLSYRMNVSNGGASSWTCYNFGWWAEAKQPFEFGNQWQTVTIPFSYYKANSTGVPLGTLDSYLLDNASTNSALAFVNFFQGQTSQPLTQFQLFLANLRIVPLVSSAQ